MHLHHWNASFECYKPSNVPGNVACPWCMPRKPQRLRDHQRFRLHNGSLTHRIANVLVTTRGWIRFRDRYPPIAHNLSPLPSRNSGRSITMAPTPTNFLTIDFSGCTLCVLQLVFLAADADLASSRQSRILDPFHPRFSPLWWLLSLETQTRHSPFWRKSFSYVPFFPRLTDSRGSRLSETVRATPFVE